ncbi:MAG: hypothetical protein JKY60_08310 [Kordiimonadaceae bacterium]|nr:hypothetical protein [Kordiimonadaceae bacterium]
MIAMTAYAPEMVPTTASAATEEASSASTGAAGKAKSRGIQFFWTKGLWVMVQGRVKS